MVGDNMINDGKPYGNVSDDPKVAIMVKIICELCYKNQTQLMFNYQNVLNTKLNKSTKQLILGFNVIIIIINYRKRKTSMSFNNKKNNTKALKLGKGILLRCNFELLERINNIKKDLIKCSNIASNDVSNNIENEILITHIAEQIKYNYGAIKFLGFFGRILLPNKFCFGI